MKRRERRRPSEATEIPPRRPTWRPQLAGTSPASKPMCVRLMPQWGGTPNFVHDRARRQLARPNIPSELALARPQCAGPWPGHPSRRLV
jgi:hypothetical protein